MSQKPPNPTELLYLLTKQQAETNQLLQSINKRLWAQNVLASLRIATSILFLIAIAIYIARVASALRLF